LSTFDTTRDGAAEGYADPDVLAQFDQSDLTFSVYRAKMDPQGNILGSPEGSYVTQLAGPVDMERLSRQVGPGGWLLFVRQGRTIKAKVKVKIEGVPWPAEAFNRPPSDLPALEPRAYVEPTFRSAPQPPRGPVIDGAMATFLRDEIRAAVEAALPRVPAPAVIPAPPTDALALFNMVLAMSERMASTTRPAVDLTGMFDGYVTAFQSGMKLAEKMAEGQDGGGDGVGGVLKALLPTLLARAGVPGAPTSPLVTSPPGGARPPGPAPMVPPAPIAPPQPALSASPAPAAPAPAPAPSSRPWAPRDFILAALYRTAATGGQVAPLADAVMFYLDDDAEFDAFTAIGEAGGFTDAAIRGELVGWLGEDSPVIAEARIMATTPSAGEVVRLVQNWIVDGGGGEGESDEPKPDALAMAGADDRPALTAPDVAP
jgi:hypothetical protein